MMIASDLVRAVFTLGFILTVRPQSPWLLYVFSALFMFASPFFTSGRSAILPGHRKGGGAVYSEFGDPDHLVGHPPAPAACWAASARRASANRAAFVINALSFVFSAWCISRLFLPGGGFRPQRAARSPKATWCGRGTNMPKGCATCAPSR